MNQNNDSIEEHHEALDKGLFSSHKTGIITIFLIFGLFGVWSVLAKISTTITAQGKVITQSYNKIVIHPVGGIIKEIFVQEGDQVKKDQPLLELDSVSYQSQLDSNIKKHDRNLFSLCKMQSQSTLQDNLDCTEYQKSIIDTKHLDQLMQDTQTLFASDMKSLEAKIDLLKSQNNVLLAVNNGLIKQIESNQRLHTSFQKELKKWNKLLKADAVDELKAIETQRRIEQSHLEIGSLQSKIKENLATIEAHKVQMELERESFKNIALTKKNELELENKLIQDNIRSLENTIESSTIRSPGDGFITDMKIHASREVVSPQKLIMAIVPTEKELIIEAYVLPTDIEKIFKGQKAEIAFPAFVDPSAIPIEGELTYISADTITPENEKEAFYKVLVKLTPDGVKAIERNGFKIMPGMPSAVFIQIGKTTLLQFLLHPITQMYKGIYNAN